MGRYLLGSRLMESSARSGWEALWLALGALLAFVPFPEHLRAPADEWKTQPSHSVRGIRL
jgi:hypothetical protein